MKLVLDVFLQDQRLGELTEDEHGNTSFHFSSEYIELVPRPTLSQFFLDDVAGEHRGQRYELPAFFSNLLPDPDGRLREIVSRSLGIRKTREMRLLAALGGDLPGAVSARVQGSSSSVPEGKESAARARPPSEEVRFSIGGVQLKVPMVRTSEGLVYPEGGAGGTVIAKLPDTEISHLTENEFSMMTWARRCGITVPAFELVPVEKLRGLPSWVPRLQGLAYVIDRFDRSPTGGKIHIEDMAQAFGLMPEKKYEQRHYWHIGKLLLAVGDHAGFAELIRRLVFMLASGNSDAHLKNWSLIYPDGVNARLSPAYDLVSTQLNDRFMTDKFALEIGRTREYRLVGVRPFITLADRCGASPEEVQRWVQTAAERVRDEWSSLKSNLPLPPELADKVEKHWNSVPILGPKL